MLLLLLQLLLHHLLIISVHRVRLLEHDFNWLVGLLWNPSLLWNNLLNDVLLRSGRVWNLWLHAIWDILGLVLPVHYNDLICLLINILELLWHCLSLSLDKVRWHAHDLPILILLHQFIHRVLGIICTRKLKALRNLLIDRVSLVTLTVSWVNITVKLVLE